MVSSAVATTVRLREHVHHGGKALDGAVGDTRRLFRFRLPSLPQLSRTLAVDRLDRVSAEPDLALTAKEVEDADPP
jgi:hypothetical protein